MATCPNCSRESCACYCNCNECATPFRVSYYPYCPGSSVSEEAYGSYTIASSPDTDGSLVTPVPVSEKGNLVTLPVNGNTFTLYPGYAYYLSFSAIGNSTGFSLTPVVNGVEMRNARASSYAGSVQEISVAGSLIIPATTPTTLALRLNTLGSEDSVSQLSGTISIFPVAKLC